MSAEDPRRPLIPLILTYFEVPVSIVTFDVDHAVFFTANSIRSGPSPHRRLPSVQC